MLGDSNDDLISDDCPNLHCELTPMPTKDKAKRATYNRNLYERDKERIKARCKAYYQANRDKRRVWNRTWKLKNEYGITLCEYEAMLEQQNGLCAICQNRMDKVCIDHCHTSGKVRGLLCDNCNKAIGLLKDNPYVVKGARDYLILNM